MNKIVEMKFGSHLYGTNTPESDLDMKAIYLPTAMEIILHNYKDTINISRKKKDCERNTKDDIDIEVFSLDRFLELLTEGQTVALDMVYGMSVDDIQDEFGAEIMTEIFQNLDKLLTRNVNAFVGYARQQAAKYGIKGSRMDALKNTVAMLDSLIVSDGYLDKLMYYDHRIDQLVQESKELVSLEKTPLIEVVRIKGPNGTEEPHLHVCGRKVPFHATVKYARQIFGKILDGYGQRAHKAHLAGGVDWKALSHAVRVNAEALELLQTGKVTFPRPERELLLQIKLGQLPYEKVAEMIEQGLADLTEAHKVSTLRDEPDSKWVKDFVYKTYLKVVKDSL
jgi:hypothetical protein